LQCCKHKRLRNGAQSTLIALGLIAGAACHGTRRGSPLGDRPDPEANSIASLQPASAGGNGAPPASGATSDPTAEEGMRPIGILAQNPIADAGQPACAEDSYESCGPPREEGTCKFGTRTCKDGIWGECVGAIFAQPRNCGSVEDNDCDGQPDNTIDGVCHCAAMGTRTCDEHAGLDGKGPCHAGQQACILGQGSLTSDWGPCTGSVGPGAADSCSVPGDDSNCDGLSNGGCTCVEGQTVPCGPDLVSGICHKGTSTCRNGAFGACQGAVFPTRRDCTSALDNDCDGLPDNTLDGTCACAVGAVQTCGAHPGRDGNGPCQAGQQRCAVGDQNASTQFGPCTGGVGPGARDSCGVPGDDADCNGSPNAGCQCIAGQGCAAGQLCTAQGQCLKVQSDLGGTCGTNADCRAGVCASGTCCSTACDPACEACGTNGVCQSNGACDIFDCVAPNPPPVIANFPTNSLLGASGTPPAARGGTIRDGRYIPARVDLFGEINSTFFVQTYEFRSRSVQLAEQDFVLQSPTAPLLNFGPEFHFVGTFTASGTSLAFDVSLCEIGFNGEELRTQQAQYTATANSLVTISPQPAGTMVVTYARQ
jgi:hypothetical protein